MLLKPLIICPLIEVGEYCYYDDPTRGIRDAQCPLPLRARKADNRLELRVGEGMTLIMNGANHRMDGPSTYPFPLMGAGWAEHIDLITDLPSRGHDRDRQRRLDRRERDNHARRPYRTRSDHLLRRSCLCHAGCSGLRDRGRQPGDSIQTPLLRRRRPSAHRGGLAGLANRRDHHSSGKDRLVLCLSLTSAPSPDHYTPNRSSVARQYKRAG